jgi:bifunctional DNA-binding transcriptional regulator/antitoxin component of YhaV-PrlF toxin-antitoxin module
MDIDIDKVKFVSETSMTIRGSRRRTTVPKGIVEELGLANGSKIRWILFEDGNILVRKVKD